MHPMNERKGTQQTEYQVSGSLLLKSSGLCLACLAWLIFRPDTSHLSLLDLQFFFFVFCYSTCVHLSVRKLGECGGILYFPSQFSSFKYIFVHWPCVFLYIFVIFVYVLFQLCTFYSFSNYPSTIYPFTCLFAIEYCRN